MVRALAVSGPAPIPEPWSKRRSRSATAASWVNAGTTCSVLRLPSPERGSWPLDGSAEQPAAGVPSGIVPSIGAASHGGLSPTAEATRLTDDRRTSPAAFIHLPRARLRAVCGRDVTNIVSFSQLLDLAEARVNELAIDEAKREEARGVLNTLRGRGSDVATSATGGLVGRILGELLGLGA